MNIDRRTLRIAHPAYVELQKALHIYLDKLIRRVKSEIYSVGSQERQVTQAQKIKEKIFDVAKQEVSKFDDEAAAQLKKAWGVRIGDPKNQKKLLRKFTVDEFYEVVIEVAGDILTPKQFSLFMTKLTERLRQ